MIPVNCGATMKLSGLKYDRTEKGPTMKTNHEHLGQYTRNKIGFFRKMTVQSFDAIPPGHNMYALLDFDVTDLRAHIKQLRRSGSRVSLFGWVIKSVATALTEFPDFNSIMNRRHIFHFEDVDVNLPIELDSDEGQFPRQIVIRQANRKTASQITVEIDEYKRRFSEEGTTGTEDRWAGRLMRILSFIPKFIRNGLLRFMINRPLTIKKMSGTTFITSVGMFGSMNGYVIPFMSTPRAVSFAVGSISRKPVFVGETVIRREFLSITVVFNHDIVDGAPSARFTNRLKQLIEKPHKE